MPRWCLDEIPNHRLLQPKPSPLKQRPRNPISVLVIIHGQSCCTECLPSMFSLARNVVAGCACCRPFILPKRSGQFLNALVCLPARRQCHPLTPSIHCSIRLRRAEMFRRLALGKCAQQTPKTLVSPGRAVIIKLRVGLERLTYCYLSDLDPDVYIVGFQNRALSYLDTLLSHIFEITSLQ